MGLLSDVSIGYLKRQSDVQKRDRDELMERNKYARDNAAKMLESAIPNMKEEFQGEALQNYYDLLNVDLAGKNASKDIAKKISMLWEGQAPKTPPAQTMSGSLQAQPQMSAPQTLPSPNIQAGGLKPGEQGPPAPGLNMSIGEGTGILPPRPMASGLPVDFSQTFKAPAPPPGYTTSVMPTKAEREAEAARVQEAVMQQGFKKLAGEEEIKRSTEAAYREKPVSFSGVEGGILNTREGGLTPNPYAKPDEVSYTIPKLAMLAAQGDKTARAALDLIRVMNEANDTEPGSYKEVVDARGNITGWVNPKSMKIIRPSDFGLSNDVFKSAMSMDRQTRETASVSGLEAISKFRAELKANPNLLAQMAIPGSPGARAATAARNEMSDVLVRIRTGAALNSYEQDFYDKQAPGLLDVLLEGDANAIEYKLSIFEKQFNALAPPQFRTGNQFQPNQGGSGLTPPGPTPQGRTLTLQAGQQLPADLRSGDVVNGATYMGGPTGQASSWKRP